MENQITLEFFVDKTQAGLYLTLPFDMPPDTETLSLSYRYERHQGTDIPVEQGAFTARQEINIIDLGLITPDGRQVGASGSDKTQIKVSETYATPGYKPVPLVPGEWQILVGAYKVAEAGVAITYELSFTPKQRRLLKGDLHAHTLASDGVVSAAELGQRARRHGLDFLAITDHNQMVSAEALPQIEGITLIPGLEWTHFKGHANFLGVDKPYAEPFFANDFEEIQARFRTAHERGALIVINHPFEEICPFQFDLNRLPFDCIEVWNGPMRESNLKAIGLWQQLLEAGKKVSITGGSDYHRDQLFIFPGGPTTCVFAKSASPTDILAAIKHGHAYLTFAPNGPSLELTAGDAIMGDSVSFANQREIQFSAEGLQVGDMLRVITNQGSTPILEAKASGKFKGGYALDAPGFARVEILRAFVPGLPLLPALVSNPIYFDAED
ncbi:MAG: CehA/McbA family metallohydrolase [Anaerolineales bacterium]|nr:CehA/McbA family metallohydrolase [Anaerolineales bacterium]